MLLTAIAVWLWAAPLRTEQKLRAASLVELESITRREPTAARATYYLGRRWLQLGNLAAAQAAFRRAQIRPGDAQPDRISTSILLKDADILLRQGRLPEAKQAYLTILEQDPKSARAYQGVGLALNAQGKQEDAFFYLERATDFDPKLPQAEFLLAGWYLQASFKKEAARRLQLATQAAPRNAAYWHELGQAYGALDVQNNSAEDAYRRAVALEPNNCRYLLDLADMLVIDSSSTEAEPLYRRAVSLAPDDADALSRYGGFLLDSPPTPAHLQEADHLLSAAVHADAHNDFAWYQLGRLAYTQGNDQRAISALGHALTLAPQIAEGWYALARAYTRLDDSAHAQLALHNFHQLRAQYQERTHTAELLDLHPKDYALHVKLARLYVLDGENAKAIFEYLTYLRFAPRDVEVRRELTGLQARLKAEGHLPSMLLFSTMVQSSRQHDRSLKGTVL